MLVEPITRITLHNILALENGHEVRYEATAELGME